MASTVKKPRQTENHYAIDCTQSEAIKYLIESNNKLSVIITGDGDPEKGIDHKVILIGAEQKAMHLALNGIQLDLKDYRRELVVAQDVAVTVKSGLEQYKASLEGEKKGIAKASTHSQVTFNNVISIISTIVIVAALLYSLKKGDSNKAEVIQKVENNTEAIHDFGTPVVVGARGELKSLAPGDSLKFFRDGQFKDGIRDTTRDTINGKRNQIP